MNGTKPAPKRFYIFTLLWAIFYLTALATTIWTDVPAEIGYFAVLGLGIPLTVMMALEWSTFLPGRKIALFLVLAGAAWWLASADLVRSEFQWRIWYPVNTVTLILVTFTVGFWLAGEIEKAGHLIPVSILGTIVDVWSVFQGPSRSVGEQVARHAAVQEVTGVFQPPPWVEFLIMSWPQPGAAYMTPLFGFGDLVFIAIFLAGSRKFGISLISTVLLLLAGLAVSIFLSFLFSAPIPVLPFICGLFLLGNFRKLSMTKAEWMTTLLVCVAILIVGLLNYLRPIMLGK